MPRFARRLVEISASKNFFSEKSGTKGLWEEVRKFVLPYFDVYSNFFAKFRPSFCQILGSVFHKKCQKVPKRVKGTFFGTFLGSTQLVVIIYKYLWDTINSHNHIRMSSFCARIGYNLTDSSSCTLKTHFSKLSEN